MLHRFLDRVRRDLELGAAGEGGEELGDRRWAGGGVLRGDRVGEALLHDELVQWHRIEDLERRRRKRVAEVAQVGARGRATRTARAAGAAHAGGLDLDELGLLLDRELHELGLVQVVVLAAEVVAGADDGALARPVARDTVVDGRQRVGALGGGGAGAEVATVANPARGDDLVELGLVFDGKLDELGLAKVVVVPAELVAGTNDGAHARAVALDAVVDGVAVSWSLGPEAVRGAQWLTRVLQGGQSGLLTGLLGLLAQDLLVLEGLRLARVHIHAEGLEVRLGRHLEGVLVFGLGLDGDDVFLVVHEGEGVVRGLAEHVGQWERVEA
mmetsp:Transcript_104263/g.300514  ORF Transcript_104263/g.300514 Transcript_104263/m.300514 type:complete len:327 (+) Transcript_104263:1814-2794(+)